MLRHARMHPWQTLLIMYNYLHTTQSVLQGGEQSVCRCVISFLSNHACPLQLREYTLEWLNAVPTSKIR